VAAQDPLLLDSLRNSLQVAGIAVAVSTVLGTLAAVYLARSRGRIRDTTLLALSLPMLLPPMLLGLAIIIGLNALGLPRGLWTILLGHIILTIPIVTLLVLVRLEGIDQNLELAAMDLGASPLVALLRVAAPQAMPGIVAAGLISFAISMDEFILTSLVTGSDSTLPLYIFGQLRFSITPAVVAVSAVLLVVSGLLLLVGALIASIGQRSATRPDAPVIVNLEGTSP
jgi:ABC-type spermidine/putrescine transport system permease subunit II